jgi:hypothetical protein
LHKENNGFQIIKNRTFGIIDLSSKWADSYCIGHFYDFLRGLDFFLGEDDFIFQIINGYISLFA